MRCASMYSLDKIGSDMLCVTAWGSLTDIDRSGQDMDK